MKVQPFKNPRRVYCAGPLFSGAERREMEHISRVLGANGFDTFVPHADGMEFAKVLPYLVGQGHDATAVGQWLHEAVFALDTYQVVEGCGSLVFNMNGRTPDEGGVAELTMAWMLGKPCVIYKDDARSMIAGRDNPLVVGQANFSVVRTFDEIAPALAAEMSLSLCDCDHSAPLSGRALAAVQAGRTLWSELSKLGNERPDEEVAEIVLELFAETAR